MKKIFMLLALAQIGIAHADWDDPTALFSTKANQSDSMNIIWRPVEDVDKECSKEAQSRGHKRFGYAVNACSFWTENTCTVITKKNTSMHTLGHEVRHCFQGNWH